MKHSLLFKIRLSFGLTIIFILIIFGLGYWIDQHNKSMDLDRRLIMATRALHHADDINPQALQDRLEMLHLKLVAHDKETFIQTHGEEQPQRRMGPGMRQTFVYQDKIFHFVTHKDEAYMFEDTHPAPSTLGFFILAFIAIVGSIVFLYKSILRGFTPLSHLTKKIEAFGNSPSSTWDSPVVTHNDEIGALAKAFDDSANKIARLHEARRLMLRNIAHELKTPLTKGRFLIEMINDDHLYERFEQLFIRLEGIIDELLQIETITAGTLLDNKKLYPLDDIVHYAQELLFLDDDSCCLLPSSQTMVYADFKLLALALKNLLDNALKYRSSGSVVVTWEETTLSVINEGTPLPHNLDILRQPFVKGEEASQGLGLGLYIVYQILNLHSLTLEYLYKDGKSFFMIDFQSIIESHTTK